MHICAPHTYTTHMHTWTCSSSYKPACPYMHHTRTLHTFTHRHVVPHTNRHAHTCITHIHHTMHTWTYGLSYKPACTYMHHTHTLHTFAHGHMVPHINLHTHIHMHAPHTYTTSCIHRHMFPHTHIPHINTHICYTHVHMDIGALKHTCIPLHPTLHHTPQAEKKREKRKQVNQVA